MALNARFQRAFDLADAYTPHLSLAYAEGLGDAALASLAARVPARVIGGGAVMVALELWDTSGPVSGWRRVRAAPLNGPYPGAAEAAGENGCAAAASDAAPAMAVAAAATP